MNFQDRPHTEIEEVDISTLAEWMATGEWTSRRIVEAYTARIQAMDMAAGGLRSVLEINPDALAIADELDRERASGRLRGPLHGIPILLKDNIDTADRMMTTAGSLALMDSRPPRDSTIARRLREVGAVLLGKTNMSEWANWRSTRSSSGWSGRGRQCRNPYALDRAPGGSSSGSGVAPAASLCAAAIGTETDGSIVSPANASGIVGIKPTVGLTSRAGVIPISHSQDSIGPLARSVRDAATVLGAIAGPCERDGMTRASAAHARADYTAFLDADGLRGARIGVPREFHFGYSEHADRVIDAAITVLRDAGAEIVDPANIPTGPQLKDSPNEALVMLAELKWDIALYLAERGDPKFRTLGDIIEFNKANADREMPYFQQERFELAWDIGTDRHADYARALESNRRLSREEGIDAVLREHRLDALIAPTGAPANVIDVINGFKPLGNFSSPAAMAGYPIVSIPAGYTPFGLPVNISFVGTAWSEPTLIKLAHALEQLLPPRRPPGYLPTIDLP